MTKRILALALAIAPILTMGLGAARADDQTQPTVNTTQSSTIVSPDSRWHRGDRWCYWHPYDWRCRY